MAETAIGLFGQSSAADRVMDSLRDEGIPADAIRIVSKPASVALDSVTSTPSLDFAAGLANDLRAMGATEEECEAYVHSVQGGDLLMFVTGTPSQADVAASLMDEYGAMRIEEFAGVGPMLPSIHVGEIGASGITVKESRARSRTEGARVFTW